MVEPGNMEAGLADQRVPREPVDDRVGRAQARGDSHNSHAVTSVGHDQYSSNTRGSEGEHDKT